MKKYYTLLAMLLMMALTHSCTLYMEDEEIPEDEKGIGEPYTIEINEPGIQGHMTIEYQEGVKVICKSNEQYIHHIDEDSVYTYVYYMPDTPEKYIPTVGDKLTMTSCPLHINGLNHRVTGIDWEDGLMKVEAMHCLPMDIYKTLDADLTYDIEYPSLMAVDSLLADSLGMNMDSEITIWDTYNKHYYPEEYKKQQLAMQSEALDSTHKANGIMTRKWHSEPLGYTGHKTAKTRGDDFNDEHDLTGIDVMDKKFDVGFGDDPGGFTLTLISINTKDIASGIDGWYQARRAKEAEVFRGLGMLTPELNIKAQWNLKSKVRILLAMIGPLPHVKCIIRNEPSFLLSAELGANLGVDVKELASEIIKKLKSLGGSKTKAELPPGRVGLPVVSPAVSLKFQPFIEVGVDLSILGRYEKTINCKTYDIATEGYFPTPLTYVFNPWGCYMKEGPAKPDSPAEVTLNGTVTFTLAGGVDATISIIDWVEVGLFAKLSGTATLNASMDLSPKSMQNSFGALRRMLGYYPSKNNFEVKVDLSGGLVAKFFGSRKDYTLVGFNIYKHTWYTLPTISDFYVNDMEYDPYTQYLTSFYANIEFKDPGLFYNTKIWPVAFYKEKDAYNYQYVSGQFIQSLESNKKGRMKIKINSPGDYEYTVLPGIAGFIDPFDDALLISGFEESLLGNPGKTRIDCSKFYPEQTFGSDGSKYSSSFQKKMKKLFGHEIKKNLLFGITAQCHLYASANVREWGFEGEIMKGDVESTTKSFRIKVESELNKHIQNGEKSCELLFLTPPAYSSTEYTVSIWPYAISKTGKKTKFAKRQVLVTYPFTKSIKDQEAAYKKRHKESSATDMKLEMDE